MLKRILDVGGALAVTMILSPLLVATALAIRISHGPPVLFTQPRLGRGGRPFRILKFRTMKTGAPDLRQADGSVIAATSDARVTRLGRVLRQTSIDELPQLWNVLRGDMSLVGPRPDLVDQLRLYRADEMAKLAVAPGMTGLAMVRGRNAISWRARKRSTMKAAERSSGRSMPAVSPAPRVSP